MRERARKRPPRPAILDGVSQGELEVSVNGSITYTCGRLGTSAATFPGNFELILLGQISLAALERSDSGDSAVLESCSPLLLSIRSGVEAQHSDARG